MIRDKILMSLAFCFGVGALAALPAGACGPRSSDDDLATPSASADASPTDTPAPTPERFLATCLQRGNDSLPHSDTVTCPDLTELIEWDTYVVNANVGDCIHVRADNGVGAADLLAHVRDAAGREYGRSPDWTQLDDEGECSVPAWDGFGCPDAAVEISVDGPVAISVGQWGGGCAPDAADYTLYVAINGVDQDLSGGPAIQDTAMD
jgi:hypothetical protein